MCFPPKYKNRILNTSSLVACLKKLATSCANEEMYQRKAMEYMKEKRLQNFQEDKKAANSLDEK